MSKLMNKNEGMTAKNKNDIIKKIKKMKRLLSIYNVCLVKVAVMTLISVIYIQF